MALMLVVLAIAKDSEREKSSEATAMLNENFMVHAQWPGKTDEDVDLWVQCPGDRPVGYSSRSGATCSLLRDDVGGYLDPTQLNYEQVLGRGLPPGEYIVNLHWFRKAGIAPEVGPITVIVSLRKPTETQMKEFFVKQVWLTEAGEEITVVRFTLDEAGDLVPETMSNILQPLRSKKNETEQPLSNEP